VYLQKLDSILNCIRSLLLNSLNSELHAHCMKCLVTLLKCMERTKPRKEIANVVAQLDAHLLHIVMPCIIPLSASTKLQTRQFSSDILFSYMKQTSNLGGLFGHFTRYGIDNADSLVAKGFIEILTSLLSDEYKYEDYSDIVKSLMKHLLEPALEKSCMKTLRRIEVFVGDEVFANYLQLIQSNLKNYYFNLKRQDNSKHDASARKQLSSSSSINNLDNAAQSSGKKKATGYYNSGSAANEDDELFDEKENGAKFNVISNRVLKKLYGEDELQRLEAVEELEMNIRNLSDLSVVYPYYEDFVMFIGNFIEDSNYKVRVGALEILFSFVKKLKSYVENCYKVICNCARQVMSQTHQSKTMKQLIMSILLLSIEHMKNPNLILECLLEKIRDRSAKAREECLNVVIAALLKFGSYKFDLISIFKKVVPLLFDIKRNVRHAALECVAVLYNKLRERVCCNFHISVFRKRKRKVVVFF
jgi:hypothetical protein